MSIALNFPKVDGTVIRTKEELLPSDIALNFIANLCKPLNSNSSPNIVIKEKVTNFWTDAFLNVLTNKNIKHSVIVNDDGSVALSVNDGQHVLYYDNGEFFNTKDKYILISVLSDNITTSKFETPISDSLTPEIFAESMLTGNGTILPKCEDIDELDGKINKFIDIISFGDNYDKCKQRLYNIVTSQEFISNIISFNDNNIRFKLTAYEDENNYTLTSDDTVKLSYGKDKDKSSNKYILAVYATGCTIKMIK